MCVVSYIGDDFNKRIQHDDYWKKIFVPIPNAPLTPYDQKPYPTTNIDLGLATKEEVAMLRREIEQLKKFLEGAVEYDKRNNEPHCEMDEKVAMIKAIADAFGVDLTEIFKDKTK